MGPISYKRIRELKKKLKAERAEEPPPAKFMDKIPIRRYIPEVKHLQGYRDNHPEKNREKYIKIGAVFIWLVIIIAL